MRSPGSLRLPKNHQLVLDVVRSLGAGVHATTREIFAAAKERRPKLGYSTVYRALIRLRDLGLLAELNVPGSPSAMYESLVANHAHFHCGKCGKVEDIDYLQRPDALNQLIRTEHLITTVSLTLHGLCASCAEAEKIDGDRLSSRGTK